jgi:hypothetical protein
MTPERVIVESAHELACNLPRDTAEAVADAILTCSEKSLRSEIAKRVPHHQHRDLALAFLDRWRREAKDVNARTVSVALQTAVLSEQIHRDSQSVELVWTGPNTQSIPFRRTGQAILQILESARNRITLVSYAVYRIPKIREALVRAARKGVQINVIVETSEKGEGVNEYSTLQELGAEVAACSEVYFWPKQKRGQSNNGKTAILHVKCAVADGRWLFLSSANLTEYAFSIHMELGVLITGGKLPAQVEGHFDRLIADSVLEKSVKKATAKWPGLSWAYFACCEFFHRRRTSCNGFCGIFRKTIFDMRNFRCFLQISEQHRTALQSGANSYKMLENTVFLGLSASPSGKTSKRVHAGSSPAGGSDFYSQTFSIYPSVVFSAISLSAWAWAVAGSLKDLVLL